MQILLSDDEESGLPHSKEERKAMRRRMKELRKKLKAEKKKVPIQNNYREVLDPNLTMRAPRSTRRTRSQRRQRLRLAAAAAAG